MYLAPPLSQMMLYTDASHIPPDSTVICPCSPLIRHGSAILRLKVTLMKLMQTLVAVGRRRVPDITPYTQSRVQSLLNLRLTCSTKLHHYISEMLYEMSTSYFPYTSHKKRYYSTSWLPKHHYLELLSHNCERNSMTAEMLFFIMAHITSLVQNLKKWQGCQVWG